MASLVADYGTSSGSDSDTDESTQNQQKQPVKPPPAVNFLESTLGDKDNTDSDDSDNEQVTVATNNSRSAPPILLPNPLADVASKLPSPALGSSDRPPECSVFVTSFHRAAEAKSSILEQHVKMTDTDLPAEVGGKKICWNFRKGKCRFGHKCKYSHGTEILGGAGKANGGADDSAAASDDGPGPSSSYPATMPLHQYQQQHHHPGHPHNAYPLQHNTYRQQQQQHQQGESLPDEDDYLSNAKRKKRAGVTDTLLPPKRAMRQLDKFREEERPWTIPK